METINGNEIVKYIFDTGYEQFTGETREKAELKFENWINKNTKYRGLTMYAKHKGYYLIFEDKHGNRYIRDGLKFCMVDEFGNIIKYL